ncbi:MAG: hypothetical protein M3P30_15005 [Chloroflexota bacterium]|nr:hypothetical protein [Chloroflexota bacterium]
MMNKMRQWWLAAAGGAVLIAVIGAGAVMAQTPSTTPGASGTPATGAPSGAFKSNEDPTHEAGETAEQEAAEDAGKGHGHGGFRGGKSNEDPAHEASESSEREAQEDAAQPSASPSTTN